MAGCAGETCVQTGSGTSSKQADKRSFVFHSQAVQTRLGNTAQTGCHKVTGGLDGCS